MPEEGPGSPGAIVRVVSGPIRMPGTKLGYSARAISSLNHLAIVSLAIVLIDWLIY